MPEESLRYGAQDNAIHILYDACKNTKVAIQTFVETTETVEVAKTVMQGDVWGPPLCAKTIDSIGKKCLEEGKYLYKYRGKVEIPPLSMLDDLMCISTCGPETIQMNYYINYRLSSKMLYCCISKF